MTTATAKGPFDVELTPESATSGFGRMVIEKQFRGDLVGTSTGEMLTWRDDDSGSAAYVAVERVTGSLHGRSGSFVLTHRGTMTGNEQQLTVVVVPDSGTDDLRGLSGTMILNNVDGNHDYLFEYQLLTDG